MYTAVTPPCTWARAVYTAMYTAQYTAVYTVVYTAAYTGRVHGRWRAARAREHDRVEYRRRVHGPWPVHNTAVDNLVYTARTQHRIRLSASVRGTRTRPWTRYLYTDVYSRAGAVYTCTRSVYMGRVTAVHTIVSCRRKCTGPLHGTRTELSCARPYKRPLGGHVRAVYNKQQL